MLDLVPVLRRELPRQVEVLCGFLGPSKNPTADIAVLVHHRSCLKTETMGLAWFREAKTTPLARLLGSRTLLIHHVRRPLDIVVSAYLYHLSLPAPEEWWLTMPGRVGTLGPAAKQAVARGLQRRTAQVVDGNCSLGRMGGMSWIDVLRCVDVQSGLIAEGLVQMQTTIQTMVNVSTHGAACNPSLTLEVHPLGPHET